MHLPSEIEARYAIPALRALIVRKLVREHGFTQEAAAKAMGLTQAAVSNYLRGTRGVSLGWEDEEEVMRHVDAIVKLILAKADKKEVLKRMNEALLDIREKGVLCNVHKKAEPEVDPDICDICGIPRAGEAK